MMKNWITVFVLPLALTGCKGAQSSETDRVDFYSELEKVYKSKESDWSKPYALIKVGLSGEDWLLTVHGLTDNKAACEEIVEPYNADPSLSVIPASYTCVEINETFSYNAKL